MSFRAPKALTCLAAICALLTGLLVGVGTANAEVHNPRQAWLRASTAGLFLHWGMFTAPRHLDCAAWERDVTEGGWQPGYWVDEARKLGASYIVLATFHSRLGYARPWPSKIPGSCSTKRDLLGELVAAGKAKGVHVLLYMTDDPQWHKETGVETLDSAAYSAYKGEQVDLTTRPGFGKYSYDLFGEVMQNYPDLGGFWIDNDNEYWEQNHLYEKIRAERPSWLLSNNNEDTPIMDTVSNEQKTGMTPAYDYPQAAFTPMPRLTEADYKLPTNGDWWYSGTDQAVDYRLSTGRYITNAGSSMKSLMAETPMVNGKFPPQQEAFNNFMASWVPPIQSSLQGKEGGGYMYGGMQPGFWNDGAHGVITVGPGAKTQYVHVVTRPTTDLVRLRDNGYQIKAVTDLRTGAPMRFTQAGGYLSILGITNWDTYDTVFKVDTSGQQYIYDGVKATASASADGHPASSLVDGNFETYWDAGAQQPVSVTLDLGKRRSTAYLAVHERENSPTLARESFGRAEDSARIKDYRVYASDDGKSWGQPVRTGALPSNRGVQFIDVGEVHARYLKLEVLNTWSGPQAKPFYHQLAIDEINVGYSYPSSDSRVEVPLEAESWRNGFDGHVTPVWCEACSGTDQVIGLGGGGRNAVTFPNVKVATAGDYRLQIDATTTTDSSLSISINDAAPVDVTIPGTTKGVVTTTALSVPLNAGANEIKVFSKAARGPGLDRIAVAPLPPASYVPKTTLTVTPNGVQWVSPGQQSIKVTAKLRLDADEAIDQVSLAPVLPAGWTADSGAATASTMRLGQELQTTWTLTSPPGTDVTAANIPITADFRTLGRAKSVSKAVQAKLRPADRVAMREAEDSANDIGDAGITSCSPCSSGQKVRNIGGSPGAAVTFPGITVATAGQYTLFIDFTVNGDRSYFVTVNGGAPIEVKVSGVGNSTPYTTSVPITLAAGTNTITLGNDHEGAPDLDRISLG